ncbi:MAG: class I SAM-dependent methyltransferase [Proteobacteria bacterium]|nr:class I SAM-dependent methyltransferase [Pseudomonadota bacterium]
MTEIAQLRGPALEALQRKVEGKPEAMLRLAALMRKGGREPEAHALARRAMALAPDEPVVRHLAREFLSGGVPDWHLILVRDSVRNDAYEAALRRAIRPGMRVLEIGTGSGILAMMAARAGAAEVVTCEMNDIVAETARKIIARNGYAGRVRVISKHSDKIDADGDLGGRMDLLVSEIVSNDLLAEDVLPAHERAVRDLLKPGAPVIPASGRIRVALADCSDDKFAPIGEVSGFDLSDMMEWRAPSLLVKSGSNTVALRSTPADLFDFDFASVAHTVGEARHVTCCASGGTANGILQWIDLTLDAATSYENAPGSPHYSCWAMRFWPFVQPLETREGDAVTIHGAHDRHHVRVWMER